MGFSPYIRIAQLKKSNNIKEAQIKILKEQLKDAVRELKQLEELKKEVAWFRSRNE